MTKTKKRSRFFAVALAMVLMLALAVPSFAAQTFESVYGPWSLANTYSNYQRVNIYRSYTGNLQRSYEDVRMYNATSSPDQQWTALLTVNGISQVISAVKGMRGEDISLNMTSQGNCIVYAANNNEADSMVRYSSMRFELVDHPGLYLRCEGTNGNIFWGSGVGNYAAWSAYRV